MDPLDDPPVVDETFASEIACCELGLATAPLDDDFCELDAVMVSTLLEIDVKTAQYNADIAHFDNWVILLGVNGSSTGNDRANESNEISDEICGKALLIANASACVIGK